MDVRGPDGKIVRFPDGTDAGKVNEVMSSIYAKPKAAPRASGTLGQLGRQVGLAARYVPEGLADLAGIVTNPINTAINTGLQAFGSKARIGTDLGQAASSTLDRIGLPKPSGGVERVVGDASRAVVGAAPFVGAGNMLARAASPVIKGVGQALAASPGAQAGYGALGGASAGTAREAGLPVPLQVAAGLGIPLGVNALGPRAVNAMRTMGQQASPKRAAEIARNVISDALTADNISPNLAGQVVSEANSRGVPLALMDVGPNTRGLASSLARKPGASRTMLTDATGPRQYSAGERIRGAVSRDLGPINNTFNESDALIQGARAKAAPLYDKAYSADLPSSDEIDAILATPAGKKALSRAMAIAANERVNPAKMGFAVDSEGNAILNPSSGVQTLPGSVKANPDRAFQPPAPDEYSAFPAYQQRTANGASSVRRKGPMDLVSWLRSRGGIQESGGELSHYGIDNKPRNIEFAKNENFLGKLINNDKGMTLDDAALAAWEAGFFPNMQERPTVSEFLDALSSTHGGSSRVFHPDDAAALEQFDALRSARGAIEGGGGWEMRGEPVSLRDLQNIPLPTAEDAPVVRPTYNTRALHYVKRGLDSVLESQRDPFGRLNKSDDMIRTTDNVRKQLLGEIDRLNPDYRAARSIYAGPAAANEALWKGKGALNKTADEIERTIANMSEFERGQYANGFRAAMAEAIDKSGGSTDIVNKLLGSAAKRKALAKIFGGEAGLNNFIKTMADEKSAFETHRRISLGSPTAANLADDAMVQDGALSNTLAPAAANLLMGRPRAAIGNVLEGAKDAWRFGVGNTAQEARNQAAALLSDTNGSALRDVLAQAARQKAIEQVRRNAIRRTAIVSGSNTRR